MIKQGQEIRVIDAADCYRWRIRPISMPIAVYKYYKGQDPEYEPPEVLYRIQYGDLNFKLMSRYYFKDSEDNEVSHPVTKRMAAYVINVSELWQRELAIFLFPMSVYAQMKESPGTVGSTDWQIERRGAVDGGYGYNFYEAHSTRYTCSRLEKSQLIEFERNIITASMKNNPIMKVLSQKVKVYTNEFCMQIAHESPTAQDMPSDYNRFDLLDLE
jgi:hypothetical protein